MLSKDITDIIWRIRQVEGVKDLAVTTNGSRLKLKAQSLKDAGLERITVSLDSLDDNRFGAMNGVGLSATRVLEGIDAAASAGLSVKVNMVVQKNINDQDIVPMARYFRERGHILRFVEFMDVGNSNGWSLKHVVPAEEGTVILKRGFHIHMLNKKWKCRISADSVMYRTARAGLRRYT